MIEAILSGVIVGISLGLTGGGGSILAVPLLIGLIGLPLRDSVAVSLAVVGTTALYGALLQRKHVRWGPGIALGIGGILGAPLGAHWGSGWPETLTLSLFAALMIFIALKMWRGKETQDVPLSIWTCRRDPQASHSFQWSCAAKLVLAGALTGIISGIFGVGGGFLLVPVLHLVAAMPITVALATSLVGIFLISAAAFTSNLLTLSTFPTAIAAWFLLGGAIGITAGSWSKKLIPADALRRVFASALVIVALWVAIRAWSGEIPQKTTAHFEPVQNPTLLNQGRQAATTLSANLIARLTAAMGESGITGALKICQAEAQDLTGKTTQQLRDAGIQSIRRIGVRTRNPLAARLLRPSLSHPHPPQPHPRNPLLPAHRRHDHLPCLPRLR